MSRKSKLLILVILVGIALANIGLYLQSTKQGYVEIRTVCSSLKLTPHENAEIIIGNKTIRKPVVVATNELSNITIRVDGRDVNLLNFLEKKGYSTSILPERTVIEGYTNISIEVGVLEVIGIAIAIIGFYFLATEDET